MGKQHIDLLALSAADLELYGAGKVAGDLMGILVHVPAVLAAHSEEAHVIGSVGTHKKLLVATVVDHRDRARGTETFPTTRHGNRMAHGARLTAWIHDVNSPRSEFCKNAIATRLCVAAPKHLTRRLE